MMQKIIILDFGSQYTQLIARRIREMHTYCEILPYNKFPEGDADVRGVVLSGSPFSVNQAEAFKPDLSGIRGKYPLLGICYGAQYLAQSSGGTVGSSDSREYGRARLASFDATDPLMQGVREHSQVWMSHGDTILQLPANFRIVASTADVPVAAYRIEGEPTWAVQFHPEVYHSEDGSAILRNFVHGICGCSADWTPASFIDSTIAELQHQLGTDQVVLGLSGGVDSTVAAMLLNRAIGDRLHCIFVDNGLLRLNEFSSVLKHYKLLGLNVTGVDASQRFYAALAGESDPEKKRKIIGKGFIEVFEEEAKKLSDVKWLAQGTIYPDRIESLSITGMVIKSHHNVGGLPERMKMQVVEPLKLLFKDEVREVGRALGIPESFIARHPFPGPGLGVRILGDITPEKVRILQEADDIFINGLKTNKLYDKVWQAGVILLPIRSVGVMGDERTYENAVALRAVCSTDGMTADWADLPNDFLRAVSNEIINKVRGINRVVYDISSKPPATIEWE
ncbi:MAG: glutamine-hydrolyzing GMP synthase [Bacteroidales bacterium]|nr:glutamine-hydrolyzing GMP synthase [Bacteroidales bacterium]